MQSLPVEDSKQLSSPLGDTSNGSNLANESGRPKKRMRFNEESIVVEAPFFFNSSEAPARRIVKTQRPRESMALAKRPSTNVYTYVCTPPSSTELVSTMASRGVPEKIYRAPYYSTAEDASEHSWEFAGLTYHLKGGDGLDTLDEWMGSQEVLQDDDNDPFRSFLDEECVSGWEYAPCPPSSREVERWLANGLSESMPYKPPPAHSQVMRLLSSSASMS